MCKAFEGNLDDAIFGNTQGKALAIKEQHDRQRAWCKRKSEGTVGWRPKKKHRLSACHWARNVDNQIKCTLGLNGLKAFVPKKDDDWTNWRHMNVAIDQGGDGLAACNFLLSV